MVVNIISELVTLGFSEYEAKAYIGLIKCTEPATAYEIAKATGIPTSKIYEVLTRLEEKELASATEEQGKKKYVAMDSDEFLARLKQEQDDSISRVSREFKLLKGNTSASAIWNFRDYDSFRARTEKMIRESRNSLLISAWKQEMDFLEKPLEDAQSRGVKISIVHFGKPEIQIGMVFQHPIEDTLYQERGGRGFAMVADTREAVIATAYGESAVEGAYSLNRGFVILTEDYIKHDVYLMKIVRRMDGELIDKFGKNYHKMRDVYTDEEV